VRKTDLYFIRNELTLAIKIGRANNVQRRLRELQAANCQRLSVVVVVPGAGSLWEKQLHRAFDDEYLSGEWFSPSAQLLELIDRIVAAGENGRGVVDEFVGHTKKVRRARMDRGNAARREARRVKREERSRSLKSDWWRPFVTDATKSTHQSEAV
jgi:hypothetical protein